MDFFAHSVTGCVGGCVCVFMHSCVKLCLHMHACLCDCKCAACVCVRVRVCVCMCVCEVILVLREAYHQLNYGKVA